tara:strand:+ start:1933 stop:2139 length:207 start_codon:yes stop_codon:yes gene_type:complete
MKRYFFIFSSALFLTTLNAQAESFWLILQNSTYGIEKIEMKNMSQCKEQGEEYSKSSGIPRYLCLIGK